MVYLNETLNQRALFINYLVHLKAGLKHKTYMYSTYSTEDNRQALGS